MQVVELHMQQQMLAGSVSVPYNPTEEPIIDPSGAEAPFLDMNDLIGIPSF